MIPLPEKKYSVIYADPPWSYTDKNYKWERGGAAGHYDTVSVGDIATIPVGDIAADDCALFMWGTWPLLGEAVSLMASWGFAYKTCAFVWCKTYRDAGYYCGLGRWTRSGTEFCLLGVRGKPSRIDAAVKQVVHAPVTRHSEKPDEVRRRIVQLMGDVPRIELFCRTRAHGWDAWGNEVSEPVPTLFEVGDARA